MRLWVSYGGSQGRFPFSGRTALKPVLLYHPQGREPKQSGRSEANVTSLLPTVFHLYNPACHLWAPLFVEQLLYTRYLLSASPLNTCRDCFTWVQTSRRLALCGSTAQTPSYLSSVIYVVLSLPGETPIRFCCVGSEKGWAHFACVCR